MSNLLTVAIAAIHVNPAALREAQNGSEEFLGLVESIKNQGFTSAISVRPATTEAGEVIEDQFQLVDGLQRYTAAKHAGLSEIHVVVSDMSDVEVLEAQLMSNVHKIETTARQYASQLIRILACKQTMTQAELAAVLGKSPA